MNNFEYYCPTRLIFGRKSVENLPNLISKNAKILMVYGSGSIKRNGVYLEVKNALNGYNVLEFSGIEPNPDFETCMKAVEIVKKEKIDFLLAVGGGSVLDGTKFIAAASKYKGEDPYDIILKGAPVEDAVKLGAIMTLPATGSEMNNGAVISRRETNDKFAFKSDKVIPSFSIIDPTFTFTLPKRQTINGIVDTFVHVMEQYCTYDVNTPLQDYWAFGILKTLIQESKKVLKNDHDYEARANICWCATCGLNHWIALGAVEDWSTHMIGHELTALYGIDHAQSLAIVLPRLLKNQLTNKQDKLAKLAREVFNVVEEDDAKAAKVAIRKIESFFNSIDMGISFKDYDIDGNEAASQIRAKFIKYDMRFGEKCQIDAKAVYDILSC